MNLVFGLLAVAELVLFGVLVVRWSSLSLALQRIASIVLAVALALAWDNAIIALGTTIGASELLLDLNRVRFLLHVIVTPTVILAVVLMGQRADLPLTRSLLQPAQVLTVVMIGLGAVVDGLWPILEPVEAGGLLRYSPPERHVPIAAIVVVAAALVVGGALWRHGVTRWLLVCSAVMFLASAVPPGEVPVLGNLAEVVFLAGLVATTLVLAADRPRPHPDPRP